VKPELRVFPPHDQQFRGEVERAVGELSLLKADDETPMDPGALVKLVRPHYPNVSIHTRTDLGSVGNSRTVWYVFRDRRVRSDDWRRDRLYDALARARAVISDSRSAIGRSRSAASDRPNRWSRR
jgi:hypothetical protein